MSKIIGIFCSDLHLTSTPPLFRSEEDNWLEIQAYYLRQIRNVLDTNDKPPLFIAGDIFDKYNPNPELINFTLRELPECFAIPGQHDLPFHSYNDINKSGFQTLIESGKITNVSNEILDFGEFVVYGFPYGQKIDNENISKNKFNISLAHQYIWQNEASHAKANIMSNIINFGDQLKGFNLAVFGDNHIAFDNYVGTCRVCNCGGFIIRKSDEIDYKPSVNLLNENFELERFYLDCSKDKYIKINSKEANSDNIQMLELLNELKELDNVSFDYVEQLEIIMNKQNTPQEIKDILLQSIEISKKQ